MLFNTLDRYILAQIIGPVAFSFFVFASLWIVNLLIRLLDLVVSKGVPVEAVSQLLLYSLPTIIVTSVPMSVLMGSMLGIARLNNDAEVIAIKASGISAIRLMQPIVLFACCLCAMVYFLNENIVPKARFLQEEVYINEITLKKPLPKVAKNIFFDGGKRFKLYVRDYEPETETMREVTMFQFTDTYPQITEAKTARIESGNLWVFQNGRTTYLDANGKTEYFIQFDQWIYPISDRYASRIRRKEENKNPKEMNLKELDEQIRIRRAKNLSTLEFETQFHSRLAFPLASIFMMLVGAPMAMRHSRSAKGKANGFGMAILILLLYYVLLTTGNTLGGNGTLPPALANWIPNLTCLGFSVYYIRKALY